MSTLAGTVGQLFDYAIELEKAAETLYRQMGELFAQEPEVALFWKHYGDEESGHAAYLERIRAEIEPQRLSLPANDRLIQAVQECLAAAAPKRLDSLRNLEDAYQLATELENSETNTIFEFIIMNFSTDELAKSHKFLRVQLSSHIAKLETEFPGRYKSSAARQSLKIKRAV